jgi:Cys-rich four helix bundle protein (predicted Tat secretion target)
MSLETEADQAHAAGREATRRGFLVVTAAAAALAGPVAAMAQGDHAGHGEHAHHHQGAPRHQKLVDSALLCVNRGEVCLDHCLKLLATGDTSLKDCVRTVSAMLPMCTALARYAALEAPRLKQLAKLCIDVCSDCESECKRHQDHHAACKACAESCAACIKDCKALLDA